VINQLEVRAVLLSAAAMLLASSPSSASAQILRFDYTGSITSVELGFGETRTFGLEVGNRIGGSFLLDYAASDQDPDTEVLTLLSAVNGFRFGSLLSDPNTRAVSGFRLDANPSRDVVSAFFLGQTSNLALQFGFLLEEPGPKSLFGTDSYHPSRLRLSDFDPDQVKFYVTRSDWSRKNDPNPLVVNAWARMETLSVTVLPEPSSLVLCVLGSAGLSMATLRRRLCRSSIDR